MPTQWNQQLISVFNLMLGLKRSKASRLQKTVECQTNEQSTKYSNWKMEI